MPSSPRKAKRLLSEAAPHVGSAVVVIGEGRGDTEYLATSHSLNSALEVDASIAMVQQALKKLRRWRARMPEPAAVPTHE